ncbi:MAG: DUF433 domain-containing protein [Gammaproteobacteria bacterium]|nr:DUF433 domain-containing protein [Gammaproteobacteria bacterium]
MWSCSRRLTRRRGCASSGSAHLLLRRLSARHPSLPRVEGRRGRGARRSWQPRHQAWAASVLRKLSEGASEADLLDAYAWLTREDIQAALVFAADTLAHEETVLLDAVASGDR